MTLKRPVVPFHTWTDRTGATPIVINIEARAKVVAADGSVRWYALVSVDAQLAGFGFANLTRLGAARRGPE